MKNEMSAKEIEATKIRMGQLKSKKMNVLEEEKTSDKQFIEALIDLGTLNQLENVLTKK